MQLEKIKKECLEYRVACIVHAESGDWILSGRGLYACDGLRMTVDMLAALFGLTAKQKDQMRLEETTQDKLGWTDEELDSVSDASEAELQFEEALEIDNLGVVGIYTGPLGGEMQRFYVSENALKPVRRKDGVTLGLRCVEGRPVRIAACEGYLTTGLFPAFQDGSELAKAVRRRVERLAELTRGTTLEEAEE